MSEIDNLDKEIHLFSKQMESEKLSLISELESGYGESIINHLNKPQKNNCFKRLKQIVEYYFIRFFKMFG
jgi:lipopolysaccharide biosynthesis glycosyltransferase